MHKWKYDVVQYETAKAREIIYEEITDLAKKLEKHGNKAAALDLLCDYNCFVIAWRDAVALENAHAQRLADERANAATRKTTKTF